MSRFIAVFMLATVCVVMMSTAVLSEAPQPESSEERAATSFSYYATNYVRCTLPSTAVNGTAYYPSQNCTVGYFVYCAKYMQVAATQWLPGPYCYKKVTVIG